MATRVSAVHVDLGGDEADAALRVLRSGRVVQGQEVAAFEQEFSSLVAGRECVAVNSGTSALHLGLLAAGIGPGDEVVVPSFTFAATANAVALTGATPVFADIEPGTFGLDPRAVADAITERTVAIMPVHLYGHPVQWAELERLAERHGLLLLEDAAQAHGASYAGTPVGALGQIAAFSFYATKNMTTGEGGMVVCRDPETARLVRLLRNQGMEQRYHNEVAGLNNRMTDLAAAIGRVQLRRLAGWNRERQTLAATYSARLRGVVTPVVDPLAEPVWHQYTVRSTDRDGLAGRLDAAGVDCAVYYPVPVHRLPAYDLDLALPETERACREVLSLPIRPGLTPDEVDRVVDAVNDGGSGRG
ncbi:DegT/DnrJ/EryC1/StrS family aminotransferase [Nocardioides cynanchi]|uniref:DegT/DnrJ/EryC1/StrS family aminotransferase n=1 Tax=Nocardioides cynanchi TaxID=2558918 RepID=UPI0012452661